MKTPKPKQPAQYERADQIPAYTSYGWRRLRNNEKIKKGDIYTSRGKPVNFESAGTCSEACGLPDGGFMPVDDNHYAIGSTISQLYWTDYLIVLRPWFPKHKSSPHFASLT